MPLEPDAAAWIQFVAFTVSITEKGECPVKRLYVIPLVLMTLLWRPARPPPASRS